MPPSDLPSGTDVRMVLQNCRCDETLLRVPSEIAPMVRACIEAVGFQALSETSQGFDGDGYTLAIVLAESHLVIHTWPEYDNLVLVDISVCDFLRPNRERTHRLKDKLLVLFQPEHHLHETQPMVPRLMNASPANHGLYLDLKRLLESRSALGKNIVVSETHRFGLTLSVDGIVQATVRDSAFYHEPLAHVPLLAHPHPERVLIVGGSDGHTALEVLKHPSVAECVLAETDPHTVQCASGHFPAIEKNVFSDARTRVITEGVQALSTEGLAPFDCILVDPANPLDVTEALPDSEHLASLTGLLKPEGTMAVVLGDPHNQTDDVWTKYEELGKSFQTCEMLCTFTPTLGAQIAMVVCSPEADAIPDQETIAERLASREIHSLEAISAETYTALFALPPRLKTLLRKPTPSASQVRV